MEGRRGNRGLTAATSCSRDGGRRRCAAILPLLLASLLCPLAWGKQAAASAATSGADGESAGPPLERLYERWGDDPSTYFAPLGDDPPVLDPALVSDTTSLSVLLQCCEGLVRFDERNRIVPCLAESWSISDDHLTYTFVLKRGVRFHARYGNGTPTANGGRELTADDVIYSLERLLDPSVRSPRAMLMKVVAGAEEFASGKSTHVQGLVRRSRYEFSIRLKRAYAPFLATLTMPNAFVVPREDVEAQGGTLHEPVGTGPFVWVRYVKGSYILLEARTRGERAKDAPIPTSPARPPRTRGGGEPGRAGPVPIERLVMVIEPDEEREFRMFMDGRLYHSTVPDPYYDAIKNSPRWAPYFTELSALGTFYFGMNTQIPPFDDPRVRKAVSCAIDKDSIVRYIKAGRVTAASGPLPPGIPGYNASLRTMGFSPERAGKLLDEAGYPREGKNRWTRKGLPVLDLYIPRSVQDVRIARAVQANLADIGIVCRLVINDWKRHIRLIDEGKAAFFRLGWVADFLDADNFLYFKFHSSNIGASNEVRLSDPRLDELLDRARTTIDAHERERLYMEAEQLIVDDCVWIPIYYYTNSLVRQPFVRGLTLTSLGDHMIRYDSVFIDTAAFESREAR